VLDEVLAANAALNGALSDLGYVDVLAHLSPDGRRIPVFDAQGNLLSADRMHVTRAGARFVGARIFSDPAWRGFPVLAPGPATAATPTRPVP
jgi:hypothetical protein